AGAADIARGDAGKAHPGFSKARPLRPAPGIWARPIAKESGEGVDAPPLMQVAFEKAGDAGIVGGRRHRARRKDAGEQRAEHAAHAVDPEDVERIVVIQAVLHAGAEVIA